ncbi:hypothetical protein [Halorientalis salina]|uniref:hypothetical protein n=1 Tax=Halorientalis salina TaxID=2932266 RepID=UPI0010AD2B5C|nr:hypothetical protein [Halorientalis salina]
MGVDSSIGDERIENDEIGVDGNWSDPDIDVDDIGNDINNSDIDADIEVELGDEKETATPENPKATKHIAEARKKLIAAHDTYTSQSTGRNARMAGVKPTTDSFQWVSIRTDVEAAMAALERASEHAEGGQAVNVLALEQVGYLLLLSAKTDRKLIDAYEHFEFATERLFNESFGQTETARNRMANDYEEANEIYQELTEKIEPKSAGVFSQLSERLYERKIRQLDGAIAAFQDFDTGLESAQSAIKGVKPAVDAYHSDEYEDARDGFMRASAEFAGASMSFTIVGQSTGLQSRASDLHATISTMEQATKDLQRSAQGRLDGERLIYYEAKRAAEEHIESDERVKNMSAFRDILF